MFALDLFNNDHERRLAEGAVDQLEQRRIDDLAMKMDDLVTRARKATTPEARAALVQEFQKCKDERDGYFKIKDECMGYGGVVGEAGLPDVADKASKMARLNQPGKAGTDVVSPQQRVNPNPNKGIIGHAADWLRGKGGPGQEGPTYESELDEGFGPVGSKALMNGNLATFMKARQSRQPVTIDVGGEQFRLTPALMDAMAKKYMADKQISDNNPKDRDAKLIAINNYRAFGYPQLMRAFIDAVATPETHPAPGEPGEQLPMFEKKQQFQKKNSKKTEPDLTANTARDATVQRELQQVRARHPEARSDIEALVKDEIVNQERVDRELDQQQASNKQQTAQLAQLASINQQQDTKIARLQQQLATAVQSIKSAPVATPISAKKTIPVTPTVATAPDTAPSFAPAELPEPAVAQDQELYNKVKELDDLMKAATKALLQRPADKNIQVELNKRIDDLQKQIEKLNKKKATTKKTTTKRTKKMTYKPVKTGQQAPALSDPNVIDIDAWTVPDLKADEPEVADPNSTVAATEPEVADPNSTVAANEPKELKTAAESIEKPTGIGQMAKNVGQGQELQKDPAYRSQVRRTQQQVVQRQQNRARQQAGYGNDPDEFGDIPNINEIVEPGAEISTNELLYRAAVEYMQHMGREGHDVDFETAVKLAAKHYGIPYRPGMVPELYSKRQELDAKLAAAIAAKQAERTSRKQRQLSRTAPTTPEQEKKIEDYWSKHAPRADRLKVSSTSLEESNMKRMLGDLVDMSDADFLATYKRPKQYWRNQMSAKPVASVNINDIESDDLDQARTRPTFDRTGRMIKARRAPVQQGMKRILGTPKTVRPAPALEPVEVTMQVPNRKTDRYDLLPARIFNSEAEAREFARKVNGNITSIRPVMHEGQWGGSGAVGLQDHYAVYTKQNGQVKRIKSTNKIGKPMNTREAEAYAAAMMRKDPAKWTHDTVWVAPADIDLDEAANPAQQAAIAIAMKKAHKKPKHMDEEFTMPGTTIPQKSVIQGYVVYYNPQTKMVSITRRGDSEEAAIEQARIQVPSMQAFDSMVSKLINRIEARDELDENKEIRTKEDFMRERDRLYRLTQLERDPASKQILKTAIRNLERRAAEEGWLKILGEESSTSSEEAESAILKRIMVAHLDLLMKFGPEKVMQAVEEVAYGVGDLDEIGSSDVSGWVHQVKDILGLPEELDEKWSAKYKRSIDCSHPKGFSQKAHCAGRKK